MIWIIGFLVISFIGTFLHFVYDLTKHNKIAALFGAVNESTWEHIKMALTPSFLWSLVDGFIYGLNPNYFIAKTLGILVLIVTIPLVFYTYTYFTKKHILIVDILTFYLAIFFSQITTYFILQLESFSYIWNYLAIISLIIIFGIYLTATLLPIKNFLSKDPITKKYGINAHRKKNN